MFKIPSRRILTASLYAHFQAIILAFKDTTGGNIFRCNSRRAEGFYCPESWLSVFVGLLNSLIVQEVMGRVLYLRTCFWRRRGGLSFGIRFRRFSWRVCWLRSGVVWGLHLECPLHKRQNLLHRELSLKTIGHWGTSQYRRIERAA